MEIMNLFEDIEKEEEDFMFQLRKRTRKARVFRERPDNLGRWSDEEFFIRYRLKKNTVKKLLGEVYSRIAHKTERNMALTAMNQLLLTLRYYATGSMLIEVGDFCGVHKSTASRVIKKFTLAIASLRCKYVNTPSSAEELKKTQEKFYELAHFPRVLGCIDCTHVKIISPGGEEPESFRNRKGYFSLNIQVLCDADMKITDVVTRWPGSSHDQTIFNNSYLKYQLSNKKFSKSVILADSGYRQELNMLTPIRNPVTPQEKMYNICHIKTRNIIERLFGIWKRRFPVLSLGIRVSVETTMAIVVACAVLHNLAGNEKEEEPPKDPMVKDVDLDEGFIGTHEIEDIQGKGREPFLEFFQRIINDQTEQ